MLLAVSKPLAVLIPLQGLEMAWPFRNGQLFPLAVLIPHQFDILVDRFVLLLLSVTVVIQ